MVIHSDRFGELKVNDQDILTFESPLLGFQNLRDYYLFEPPEDNTFVWLQSVESPAVAFPLIESEVVHDPYDIELHGADLIRLGTTSFKDNRIISFALVSMSNDPSQVTANFMAPVLVHCETRRGIQIILESTDYDAETPIFEALKKAVQRDFFNQRKLVFGPGSVKRVTKTITVAIASGANKRHASDESEPSIH